MFLAKIYRFKLPRAKKKFWNRNASECRTPNYNLLDARYTSSILAFEVFDWSISVINNNLASQNLIYK